MSRIKICGLSRAEDIEAVNNSLPDYVGFVFAESRRRVSAENAAALKVMLNAGIKAVGVFVNQDIEDIVGLYRDGIIDLVQLHGDEDDEYIRRLRKSCGCRIIKAVNVDKRLPDIPERADYLLFDTASAGRGGAGKTFDWTILKGHVGVPYFLAGGLCISNITEAINLLNPFCVDLSGGAETNGVKEKGKIDALVRMVRRSV